MPTSMVVEREAIEEVSPVGSMCCEGDVEVCIPVVEGACVLGGRSSGTVDCLFARLSSSASSAISIRRRSRNELVEEDMDPDAVCNEHAADRVVSRSSLEDVIGKTVSWGENRSVTALK